MWSFFTMDLDQEAQREYKEYWCGVRYPVLDPTGNERRPRGHGLSPLLSRNIKSKFYRKIEFVLNS